MTDRYHSASGERGKAGKAPPPRSYNAVPSPRVKAANNSYPSIEGGYQVPHSAGVARSSKEQEQGEEDRVEIEVKDRGGRGYSAPIAPWSCSDRLGAVPVHRGGSARTERELSGNQSHRIINSSPSTFLISRISFPTLSPVGVST